MAAVAVCAALAGCSDGLQAPDVPTGAGRVAITLKNSNATRSVESDNTESLIKNVVVALYPREYGEDHPAEALQRFEGIDKNNSTTVQMKLTDDMVKTLFNGTSGAECNLYAVANVDLSDIPDNATIADLKNVVAGSRFNELKVQESFVMAGSGTVTYNKTNGVESASGSGELVRAAAKISLNIKLPESVTDADGAEWVPAISSTGGVRAILSNGVKTSVAAPGEDWQPSEDDYYSLTMRNAGLVRELPNSGDGSEYPYHIDVPFYTYPNQWEETPEEQHKTMMTLVVPWQKRGEEKWNTYYYQVPVTNLTKIVSNYSYVVNLNVGMLGSLLPETPETLEDLSYQIVNWSTENIDVDIKDTRYLVVSPNKFRVNNEAEFSFPYYSSHPIKVTNIEMNYKRYNYYSNGNGDVVTINVNKDQIKNSYVIQDNDTTQRLCTAKVAQDELGQTVLKVNHPLKVWLPYNQGGTEVQLTGRPNNSDNSPATVQGQIEYYRPASPEENAYSPYEIRITIQHTDNEAFTETVTITQYPGMYIEAKPNGGGSYDGSYDRTWVSTGFLSGYFKYTLATPDYGFVYVNPTYTLVEDNEWGNPNPEPFWYWSNSTTLGGVHGLTGDNKNPNMYVITVSVLDNESSKYVIGDPRSLYTNNSLSGSSNLATSTKDDSEAGSWSVSADALYDNKEKRNLKYYYPTIEADANDENYSYMIAPKIRIASSYGVTNPILRENARRRAASYQEQGCPAGRWRLPTLGEFTYITQLSAEGKIPELFTQNNNYLTAQGAYQVKNVEGKAVVTRGTNQNSTAIRAVYDEWYWEEEKNYVLQKNSSGGYDFTWGDVPRNLTRSNALINMYKSKNKK